MRRLASLAVALAAGALLAGGADSAQRPTEVRVAFVKNGNLVFVARPLPRRESAPGHALRELLQGPTAPERAEGLRSAFTRGAVLRSIRLDEKTFVASFSARVLAPATPRTMATRVAQIAATLADLDRAEVLVLAVNGRLVDERPLRRHTPWWRPKQVPPTGAVRPGAYPYSIRGVQLRLRDIRFLDQSEVTGTLDYQTSQALLAFQGWNGLPRTGTIDEGLLVALVRASRPQPGERAAGRRIEIHRDRSVVLMIENNEVVRAVHTSTGFYGVTRPGLFRVYSKSLMSWSNLFHVWMPYASYFDGGRAMHEYPYVPAYPASHGCVRLPAGEAVRVYDFATIGTPVRVF